MKGPPRPAAALWTGLSGLRPSAATAVSAFAARPLTAARRRAAKASCRAASRARICASRSEEHTSELQSLMRLSYAVFCLQKQIRFSRVRCRRNTPEEVVGPINRHVCDQISIGQYGSEVAPSDHG